MREAMPSHWGTLSAQGPSQGSARTPCSCCGSPWPSSRVGEPLGREIGRRGAEAASGEQREELQRACAEGRRQAGRGPGQAGGGRRSVAQGKALPSEGPGRQARVTAGENRSPPETFCILLRAFPYLYKPHVAFGDPRNVLGLPKPPRPVALGAHSILPVFLICQKGSCLELSGQFLSSFRLKTFKSPICYHPSLRFSSS